MLGRSSRADGRCCCRSGLEHVLRSLSLQQDMALATPRSLSWSLYARSSWSEVKACGHRLFRRSRKADRVAPRTFASLAKQANNFFDAPDVRSDSRFHHGRDAQRLSSRAPAGCSANLKCGEARPLQIRRERRRTTRRTALDRHDHELYGVAVSRDRSDSRSPVSYTHLTLPTTERV